MFIFRSFAISVIMVASGFLVPVAEGLSVQYFPPETIVDSDFSNGRDEFKYRDNIYKGRGSNANPYAKGFWNRKKAMTFVVFSIALREPWNKPILPFRII